MRVINHRLIGIAHVNGRISYCALKMIIIDFYFGVGVRQYRSNGLQGAIYLHGSRISQAVAIDMII
ncbi:hypothetical protein D3C86_1747810 [compost metagenome]